MGSHHSLNCTNKPLVKCIQIVRIFATIIMSSNEKSDKLPNEDTNSKQSTATQDPKNVQELTTYIQSMLQQMQDRFQTMSDQIISRIDDMGARIDDLEQNINDLMVQAGQGGEPPALEKEPK